MQEVLRNTQSFTTDLGVESAIPEAPSVAWPQFELGLHTTPPFRADDGDDSGNSLVVTADAATSSPRLFPKAVAVPGMNHVLDNLEKAIQLKCLASWADLSPKLDAICDVLCKQGQREWFIHACVHAQGYPGLASQFQRSFHRPIEWRWHTLADVLLWLLPLSDLFRKLWDGDRFASRRGRESQDIPLVSLAVQDHFFWSYLNMLALFHKVSAGRAQKWCESCPCHSRPLLLEDVGHGARSGESESDFHDLIANIDSNKARLWSTCPMTGKRGPEIATGGLAAFCEDCFLVAAGKNLYPSSPQELYFSGIPTTVFF